MVRNWKFYALMIVVACPVALDIGLSRYAVAAGWEEHPVITEVWEGVVPAGRT